MTENKEQTKEDEKIENAAEEITEDIKIENIKDKKVVKEVKEEIEKEVKEVIEDVVEKGLKEESKSIEPAKPKVETPAQKTKASAKSKVAETPKVEKEFIIPLREKIRVVPRYKKANKAIKSIKEFLVRHMKIYDRDLNKIKLDKYLNEAVWARGIRKPPAKIKVKAVKEGDIVRVELVDMPNKLKFKKAREEKREQKAIEVMSKKKPLMQKAKEKKEEKSEEEKADESEKSKEAEEKKSAVVEAGRKMEKAAAKQIKHQAGGKTKQKTRPVRVALEK